MFEWLKFKIKHYISPEDKLLDSIQKPMTRSQQAESDQYKIIYEMRDNPNYKLPEDNSDNDFI